MASYRTPGQRFGEYGGTPTNLVCPRGHGVLTEKEVAPALALAYCPECGGVFASRGAFFRLRNVEEADVALFTSWLSALSPHPEPAARARCPSCAEPMDRMVVLEQAEGIALDTCFAHGVWFDGGELEAARAHDTVIPAALTKVEEARMMKLLGPPSTSASLSLPYLLPMELLPHHRPEHGLLWFLLHLFDLE